MNWSEFFRDFFSSRKISAGKAEDDFALMVAGGDCNIDEENLKKLCRQASYILACDRGFDILAKNCLSADLVIGDFDSSSNLKETEIRKRLAEEDKLKTYPERKNKTDSELGLDILFEKNYKNVVFIGGLGTRLDHSLANLLFLKKYTAMGMNLVMLDKNYFSGYILTGIYNFKRPEEIFSGKDSINSENTYVSFIALDEGLEISLEGFDYNLESTEIGACSSLCVSNHIFENNNKVVLKGPENQGLYFIYSHENNNN